MKTCSICHKPTHIYTHPWSDNTPLCLPCNEMAHQPPPDDYCASTIEIALADETHLIECPSAQVHDIVSALRLDGVEKFITGYRDETFRYDTWIMWWEDGLRLRHEVLDPGFSLEIHLVPPGTIETWD